ncbi:aldo/keto reductase [Pelagibacterium xiamenense]|uniref:aldo/keto reductase n=1 Tax=Pelagibacterium xiamenense TaxID=2901140 RepID=UPI001E3602D6|nr:aldo/keto reductase [Pelagibacterium xiamenense]MCD7060658.1 aldo/keto reductase [Pelagibacterium xiamenense]
MEFRELGRTGISVSRICLGTMTWGEQNSEADAHAQIDYALERGVNFLDTAELYSTPARAETQGRTEEYIGNWLQTSGRRQDVVIASKITGPGNEWIRGGRPIDGKEVVAALDASLKRLRTDYIDLYQLHWPNRRHYNFNRSWGFDPFCQGREGVRENMLETLEALDAQVKAGKIRAVGVSNETSWGLMEFLRLAREHNLPRLASIQNEYNLLRRHFDLDLAEVAYFEEIALLAYSPLGGGVLSGKYLDGQVPRGTRGDVGDVWRMSEHSEPAIRAYVELAKAHGLDPCQMALAYCLTKPFMTSVIIGATSMAQLEADIGAADLTLSDTVLEGIEAIHRRYPRTV